MKLNDYLERAMNETEEILERKTSTPSTITTSFTSKFMTLHGHAEQFVKDLMKNINERDASKAKKTLKNLEDVVSDLKEIFKPL